jgi:hypothetical protein
MTRDQQLAEVREIVTATVDRWCPKVFNYEPFEVRMMRAILAVNAYEMEVERALKGERAIRTDFHLPLPVVASEA